MRKHHNVYDGGVIAAIDRLIAVAGDESEQAGAAARFLLAWWDAAQCGGFDLTDLQAVDEEVAEDMTTVFGLVARRRCTPESLGYGREFEQLRQVHRHPTRHSAGSVIAFPS